jgi:hypothetical protein
MRLKGWGSPNSNEGTYTVVLYIYKYFVVSILHNYSRPCTFDIGSLVMKGYIETRDFLLQFFHESVSPGPPSIPLEPF